MDCHIIAATALLATTNYTQAAIAQAENSEQIKPRTICD